VKREPGISRNDLDIPGLRFAHPGMTEFIVAEVIPAIRQR
jgi:hypothetical protein